ncbi:hypothetical protein [Trueperella pyogenes]|uniref:hypothetical protein n=1 Tax=Trueperella pyogenes TaxID=1661 RepID=UPI0006B25290|nr:hypothetical protein [Trueperella pyogenes]ALD74581.1 hypothetical protein AN946_10060 [Trueperella pyogenes]
MTPIEETTEITEDNATNFLATLTMAELAMVETSTGVDLGNMESTSTTAAMRALAIVAARRLGHHLTPSMIDEITAEEMDKIIKAGADAVPTRSDQTEQILAEILGKGPALA